MPRRPRNTALLAVAALVAAAALPGAALAQSQPTIQDPHRQAGVRRLHFGFGALRVRPGHNTIAFDATRKLPEGDGWIVGLRPNVVLAGGGPAPYRSPAALRDGPRVSQVTVGGFLFGQGDLSAPGAAGLPPVVAPGQPPTFVNGDAGRDVFHTITGCRLPCTRRTGIAFPLADGPVFDSGELGLGPAGFTAAANRVTWQTPATLAAGTYAYFCRVHPFMRGAFRVKG